MAAASFHSSWTRPTRLLKLLTKEGFLLSAPAAALQANKRGASTGMTIGAGLLGPVYLLFSGYREGLGR